MDRSTGHVGGAQGCEDGWPSVGEEAPRWQSRARSKRVQGVSPGGRAAEAPNETLITRTLCRALRCVNDKSCSAVLNLGGSRQGASERGSGARRRRPPQSAPRAVATTSHRRHRYASDGLSAFKGSEGRADECGCPPVARSCRAPGRGRSTPWRSSAWDIVLVDRREELLIRA